MREGKSENETERMRGRENLCERKWLNMERKVDKKAVAER